MFNALFLGNITINHTLQKTFRIHFAGWRQSSSPCSIRYLTPHHVGCNVCLMLHGLSHIMLMISETRRLSNPQIHPASEFDTVWLIATVLIYSLVCVFLLMTPIYLLIYWVHKLLYSAALLTYLVTTLPFSRCWLITIVSWVVRLTYANSSW